MTKEQNYGILKSITKDTNLKDDKVTLSDLYFLTGQNLTMEDVISNHEKLDSRYRHIYKSYGFDSFYDLYLYADSNTEPVLKGGNKDLANLKKVKRKVMRNGKMIDMTIYEDGNGEDDNNMDSKRPGETNSSALRAKSSDNGDLFKKSNPKKLAGSLKKYSTPNVSIPSAIQSAGMFKEFTGDAGEPLGMMAVNYDEETNTIRLEGYLSTPESTGVGLRSILELIKMGIQNDTALYVYDIQTKEGIEYLLSLGFKKKSDGYHMNRKNVRLFIGDNSDLI